MLIRLILWAIAGFLLYTVIQAARQAMLRPRQEPPPEKSRGGETMERDPHCGTYVPRGDAVTATVRGQQHWFCSARCRDEYSKQG